MKEKIKKLSPLLGATGALVTMITLLIIFSCLKSNPDIAEKWSEVFGSFYFYMVGPVFGWLPFSMTELFFLIVIIFTIVSIVKMIIDFVKKNPVKAISRILAIINIVVGTILTYTISCEFAYNRAPVDLPYYSQEVDNSEFKDIYNYFADDLNYCISQLEFDENGDLINTPNFDETGELVEEAYEFITSDYFYKTTVHVKPMMSSILYREFQITGVTFAPFGEPNINTLSTKLELPFVMAHELAHTKGTMREDEANQVAFYVCLNSDHYYLRFSAYALYFYQLSSIVTSSYISQEEIDQLHPVNSKYNSALRFAKKYWKEHDLLGDIAEWFNNLYIQSSGVPEGTSSYQGGTEIIVDPVTLKLHPNKYQKLFFENYYREAI